MFQPQFLFSLFAGAVGAGYALYYGSHVLRFARKSGQRLSSRSKKAALGAALAAGYTLLATIAFLFFT